VLNLSETCRGLWMPTRTALAFADDGGWRRILVILGLARAAGTASTLFRGYKVGPLDALGALSVITGLLSGDR
jgi:hypothetical protein